MDYLLIKALLEQLENIITDFDERELDSTDWEDLNRQELAQLFNALSLTLANRWKLENKKVTIKDYADMPKVVIDGKEYVDRDIFVGYAINLLQQEINASTTIPIEKLVFEVAINIIGNIK